MKPQEDSLFKHYPLNQRVTLSTGEAPTPYHIYQGYGMFIGGTADLAAAQELLKAEQIQPVQTTQGRALMGIWICNFTDASLGPHHELQFSIFVSPERVQGIAPQPLGLLAAMLTRPAMQMMCHGLWNNTAVVVAYNRELLSLNARLMTSEVCAADGQFCFTCQDQQLGRQVATGEISIPQRASLRAGLALMGQIGLRRVIQIAQQPWVRMQIVNPTGVRLVQNLPAEAFTKNDVNWVRYVEPKTDRIEIGDPRYQQLGFQPQFVQWMSGFKFVYLAPQKAHPRNAKPCTPSTK